MVDTEKNGNLCYGVTMMNKENNNPYAAYILSKARDLPTAQPCTRQVPDRFANRFSTYEEYQEAMADFLNGMWRLTRCTLTLAIPPNPCNDTIMNKTTYSDDMNTIADIVLDSNGIYASDERLAGIAAECIAAERAAVAARRAALAAGAQETTWLVNW